MAPQPEVVDHVRPPAAAPGHADNRSTGQLLGDIVTGLQTIVRKELELAFLLLAGAALVVASSRARAVPLAPEKTRRSIEENARWARTQLQR